MSDETLYRVCVVSGERFPENEMLQYGNQWVAPENKDAFIQSLSESTIIENESVLVGRSLEKSEIKESLLWWEKQRLVYNVLIGFIGISGMLDLGGGMGLFAAMLIGAGLYALILNSFYCLGPLTDIYFRVFRGRGISNTARWILWTLGTGISVLMTLFFAIGSSL